MWPPRPSRRRVLARRPARHSVAKSTRAFPPTHRDFQKHFGAAERAFRSEIGNPAKRDLALDGVAFYEATFTDRVLGISVRSVDKEDGIFFSFFFFLDRDIFEGKLDFRTSFSEIKLWVS